LNVALRFVTIERTARNGWIELQWIAIDPHTVESAAERMEMNEGHGLATFDELSRRPDFHFAKGKSIRPMADVVRRSGRVTAQGDGETARTLLATHPTTRASAERCTRTRCGVRQQVGQHPRIEDHLADGLETGTAR